MQLLEIQLCNIAKNNNYYACMGREIKCWLTIKNAIHLIWECREGFNDFFFLSLCYTKWLLIYVNVLHVNMYLFKMNYNLCASVGQLAEYLGENSKNKLQFVSCKWAIFILP